MKLFHAFPRPLRSAVSAESSGPTGVASDEGGLEVLRLILTHGLLCTPENFDLYPNYHTENEKKKWFLDAGQPHDKVTQSRGCFSLVDAPSLSKEYELTSPSGLRYAAHSDLFGKFAIGIDPMEARTFGVLPAVYFYRHDLIDEASRISGLGSQIVERLDEIRNVFAVLAYIEGRAHEDRNLGMSFPRPDKLHELNIRVRHQDEIEQELETLGQKSADYIFKLLNTDRVPAWNLYDFVEIMLSLFQTTDSTVEDSPLAFFNQREWRLVHHKTLGLNWIGLGDHSEERNPLARFFERDVESMRMSIRQSRTWKDEDRFQWFLDHCWIFAGTKDLHFRDFVREIVVPKEFCATAQGIVDSLDFKRGGPVIKPLSEKWRVRSEDGIPSIVSPQVH